ncbi:MAG: MFS transporter, partial [Gammaproteobacteria bacterium]
TSSAFRSAVLTNGEMAAFYNAVAFLGAFLMVPLARRWGAGPLHPLCLVAGVLRVSIPVFLLLVTLGKLARYAALAWLM